MTKHTPFGQTAAALRDLDPAPETTLTDDERRHADALLYLSRSTSTAYHFLAGVDIFGATLGAMSGYSTKVDFRMNFGTANTSHWLCGNNGPVTSSALVWAR